MQRTQRGKNAPPVWDETGQDEKIDKENRLKIMIEDSRVIDALEVFESSLFSESLILN